MIFLKLKKKIKKINIHAPDKATNNNSASSSNTMGGAPGLQGAPNMVAEQSVMRSAENLIDTKMNQLKLEIRGVLDDQSNTLHQACKTASTQMNPQS